MVKRCDKDLDGLFGALSAEIRRRILERLRERPMVVAELAAAFEVSWPAISRHLKVLEQEGLVERRVDGRLHRIQLAPGRLAPARGWLEGFEATPSGGAAAPPRPAPLAAAAELHAALAPAMAVVAEALRGAPGGPGPRTYLAGLLRRRCAADPELRATLAEGWRRHQELGTWLVAGDADPAGLLAATFTLGQLAYALHGDPSLRDLHLASTTPA